MGKHKEEVKQWARICYGGYMNMCRESVVKPIPYHAFADLITQGLTTLKIFNQLHKN